MNNNIEKEIFDIYVDDIIPNRFQPRLTFDERALNELADSIKQHGIIQPLVVRKTGEKYEIIAGERRYKAAQIAGLQKVPAVIMNLSDAESAEVAVVENIQRRDLSALEEAESYKKLLDKGYLTQEQLATRMGKAQATISNKLRLLNLDEEVKNALLNEKISERHARSLLSLKDSMQQRDILNKIINQKLTVKQTDDLIRSMINNTSDSSTTGNTNNATIETLDFEPITPSAPIEVSPYQESPSISMKEQNNISDLPFLNSVDKINNQISIDPINNAEIITPSATVEVSPYQELPSIPMKEQNNISDIPFVDSIDKINNSASVDPLNSAEIITPASIPTIDVNQIKKDSVDINPIDPVADVNTLLGINQSTEVNQSIQPSLPPVQEEQKFRFLNPFDEENEENNNKEESPIPSFNYTPPSTINESVAQSETKTYTDSLVEEYRNANGISITQKNAIIPGDLKSAINAVREMQKILEDNNFKVDVEEFDFEHLYQMIFKINK